MARKVSKESRYNRSQDLFAEAYGELSNEGTDWTNEQIDSLLDAFLVEDLRYLSSRNCLRKVTGRSQESVSNMLWKIAVNYDRASVREYTPTKRTDRSEEPFTIRDRAIIEAATGYSGQKNNAFVASRIAGLLGRAEDEIIQFYIDCRHKIEAIGPTKFTTPTLVNRVVAGSHRKLMKEIRL